MRRNVRPWHGLLLCLHPFVPGDAIAFGSPSLCHFLFFRPSRRRISLSVRLAGLWPSDFKSQTANSSRIHLERAAMDCSRLRSAQSPQENSSRTSFES